MSIKLLRKRYMHSFGLLCSVYSGNSLPAFWGNVSVLSSRVKKYKKKACHTVVRGLYRGRGGQWLVLIKCDASQ
jgi:hypothetical protein